MRQNVPSTFQDTHRQISASLVVGKDHPQFADFPSLESYPGTVTANTYDFAGTYENANTGRQFVIIAGSNNIYRSAVDLTSSNPLINRTFVVHAGLPAAPNSLDYLALSAGPGTLYCAVNGIVYYLNGATWVQLADLTDTVQHITPMITLCAVDRYSVAVAAVYTSGYIYDNCKLSVITHNATGGAPVVDTWKGYLPKHSTRPGLAAYADADNTIYLYVDDWSGKRPLYIRRFAQNVWSATKKILPTDALDEDSLFNVGFATQVGSRMILTGTLKRQYGPAYAIYMVGPEKFTFGRDLIIKSSYSKPLTMVWKDQHIWAVGQDDIYRSLPTSGIFTDTLTTQPLDLHGFVLETTPNTADRLSLDIPKRYVDSLPNDLIPGSRVDLTVKSNGQSYALGRYGIDRVRKVENETGDSYTVDCTSYAMKKLLDWQSDTYFDYMGQGEVHGNPGDLTKIVTIQGSKLDRSSAGLKAQALNETNYFYTVPAASHGGFIKCKFTNVQAQHTCFGVGLNYSDETLAEAAERLGKKIEDVAAGQRGRWALVAIYNPDPYAGASGKGKITLYDYNTNRIGNAEDPNVMQPYREVASVYVNRPAAGGTAVMAMQYQDGYARVYYGSLDTPDLQLVLSSTAIFSWELHKIEHENYGRGMIYMRNNTGYHMAYPFMSDSDVIPLYGALDKAKVYGIPFEDRIDKFPASGQVVVDSEYIVYSGIAGVGQPGGADNRTLELDWLPGEILCQAGDGVNTPAGTPSNFAQTRGTTSGTHYHGNNYLLQMLPNVIRGKYLTAVRVWLKKVNYPEDGVTLSINAGNVGSSSNAVALVNAVRAWGSQQGQLSAAGGWVTFWIDDLYLDPSTEYWIMIRRNKNPNHPSSAAYFQYMRMADSTIPNAGAYVFCEEDDQAVGQGGDMAFVAYAKPEGPSNEFCIPVKYFVGSGIPDPDYPTYFNNQAAAITNGSGKNNAYKIVRTKRWVSGVNNLLLIYIDRNPGRIFDIGTKVTIVPAFYGLTRGKTDLNGAATTASAHGDHALVHNPTNIFVTATYFEYYSADEDLTLAEAAEDIARKAGILTTNKCNRHSGTVASNAIYEYINAQSKNVIIDMTIPLLGAISDYAAVIFYDDQDREVMVAQLTLIDAGGGKTWGTVIFQYSDYAWNDGYGYGGFWQEYPNNVLSLPFDEKVKGNFRFSLYDGHMAMWCGSRLLGAANFGNCLKAWTRFIVKLSGPATPMKVMIPQASTRVDNFVMDMGKTGSQLMSSLIGEKRVYYHDDGAGNLEIYTDRETVPGHYARAVSRTTEQTDIGLTTRVLLEGGEVVEVSSAGNIDKYGNLFKTFNFNEINNLDDAQYFANLVLEDMTLNRERVEIEGAADPRIEPTDIITITQKDGSTRTAVVDGVSQSMRVDESDAVYDMRLSGRYQ